jgi:hypothetical protein
MPCVLCYIQMEPGAVPLLQLTTAAAHTRKAGHMALMPVAACRRDGWAGLPSGPGAQSDANQLHNIKFMLAPVSM